MAAKVVRAVRGRLTQHEEEEITDCLYFETLGRDSSKSAATFPVVRGSPGIQVVELQISWNRSQSAKHLAVTPCCSLRIQDGRLCARLS